MRIAVLTKKLVGEKTALPIHDGDGRLLLAKDSLLSERLIDFLMERGYSRVALAESVTEDVSPDDGIRGETRYHTINALRDDTKTILEGEETELHAVNAAVESIIGDVMNVQDGTLGIYSLHSFDSEIFTHSVNVCVLSLIIGNRLAFSPQRLKLLGIGALLHDIGKLLIPKNILSKPSYLNEKERNLAKTHAKLGWELLTQCHSLGKGAALAALHHHERLDGTGYPQGLKGSQISIIGKIVAVADVYEAMCSDRPQRKALFPAQAYDYLQENRDILFEGEIIDALYPTISLYPTGSILALEKGFIGVVIKQDPRSERRPVVRLVKGPDIDEPVDVALYDTPHLVIETILPDYPKNTDQE